MVYSQFKVFRWLSLTFSLSLILSIDKRKLKEKTIHDYKRKIMRNLDFPSSRSRDLRTGVSWV